MTKTEEETQTLNLLRDFIFAYFYKHDLIHLLYNVQDLEFDLMIKCFVNLKNPNCENSKNASSMIRTIVLEKNLSHSAIMS